MTAFTFHYASTLSEDEVAAYVSDLHLHSTMLLLYQTPPALCYVSDRNLHSTMLLLYLYFLNGFGYDSNIYIPLCFYFISWCLLRKTGCGPIYIPLCFYFIEPLVIQTINGVLFTFHYASTLSIYSLQSFYPSTPFTFHYASTLSYTCPTIQSLLYKFTFHYASTLSGFVFVARPFSIYLHSTMLLLYRNDPGRVVQRCRDLHSTMLLLYRYESLVYKGKLENLHSTMLLLYPQPCTSLRYRYLHLHSTMLLLYPSLLKNHCTVSSFTFHYASTLSRCMSARSNWISHLHSTMLLLYPSLSASWVAYRRNLHSTMLLLYPIVPENRLLFFLFTFHYASTLSRTSRQISLLLPIYIPLCFYFIYIPGSSWL